MQKTFTMEWKSPAVDGLPKKPGKRSYEQIPCLCIRRHGVELLVWNCEHKVWDRADGDDYACDATGVIWYAEIPDGDPSPRDAEEYVRAASSVMAPEPVAEVCRWRKAWGCIDGVVFLQGCNREAVKANLFQQGEPPIACPGCGRRVEVGE